MKKLKRNAEKFDVLELFSDMAAKYGYNLTDPTSIEDFTNRVRSSITESKNNKISIYGKRVESAFAYVSGALGKTRLLKQEDSGDLYSLEEDVLPPDYRLILDNNQQFLIEVKNNNSKASINTLNIKKNYYDKLKRYADLNSLKLKFAYYLSSWNLWTLLSIESFDEKKESFTIDFVRAIACSEMALLGDCMIGTTPNLEIHLLTAPEEASEIDEHGSAPFITREIKLFCAG